MAKGPRIHAVVSSRAECALHLLDLAISGQARGFS
jgi:hypothetical protein